MISSFLLSQILIGIAFIFDLSSFQFRNRKHILICFTIAASLISAHFFLLGENTAGSVVALSAVRFVVSIFTTDKRLMWLFLGLILFAGIVTFDGLEDILSVSAMLLSTFSAFSAQDKKLRLFMMCGTVLMITHNILIFSPAAIILEVFFLLSNLFAYYRYYLKVSRSTSDIKVKKSIQLTTDPLEELLKNGESLDFRLDQEAWQELKTGDYVEFWEDFTGWQKEPTEDARKVTVKIEHVYKAPTFKELFDVIEKEFTRLGDKEGLLTGLRSWWSEDKEVSEGVLAFHVTVVK